MEIKKAVPQEDMRRHPEPYRGGGGGRYPRGGDSYGRDPYAGGYARSMGGYGMGGVCDEDFICTIFVLIEVALHRTYQISSSMATPVRVPPPPPPEF